MSMSTWMFTLIYLFNQETQNRQTPTLNNNFPSRGVAVLASYILCGQSILEINHPSDMQWSVKATF